MTGQAQQSAERNRESDEGLLRGRGNAARAAPAVRTAPSAARGIALGTVVVAFALGGLWFGVAAALEARSSRAWPSVPGRIIHSAVGSFICSAEGRSCAAAQVRYAYAVDGHPYEGDRIAIPPVDGSQGVAASAVAAYPVGRTVSVYHDPNAPARSVLQPGPKAIHGIWLLASLAALGLGASVLRSTWVGRQPQARER